MRHIKQLLLSFILISSNFANTSAMEKQSLERTPVVKLTGFSHTEPFFDSERYMHMRSYTSIEPDFMKAVVTAPPKDTPYEVLEICAGQGFTLESILKAQTPRSAKTNYTVVELSASNMDALKKRFQSNQKDKPTSLKCATKDVVSFLLTNLGGKRDKYDFAFGGFALHVLNAPDFVKTIDGL